MTIRARRSSIRKSNDTGAACGRRPHCSPTGGPLSRDMRATGLPPPQERCHERPGAPGTTTRVRGRIRGFSSPEGGVPQFSRPARGRDFKPAAQVTSGGQAVFASGALHISSRVSAVRTTPRPLEAPFEEPWEQPRPARTRVGHELRANSRAETRWHQSGCDEDSDDDRVERPLVFRRDIHHWREARGQHRPPRAHWPNRE